MPFRRPQLQQRQQQQQDQHRDGPNRSSYSSFSQRSPRQYDDISHESQQQSRRQQGLTTATPSTSLRRLSSSTVFSTPSASSTLSHALDMHPPTSSSEEGGVRYDDLFNAQESPSQQLLSEGELYQILSGGNMNQPPFDSGVEAADLLFDMVHPLPPSSQNTSQVHYSQFSPNSSSFQPDQFNFQTIQYSHQEPVEHDSHICQDQASVQDELPVLALSGITSAASSGILESPFSAAASRSSWRDTSLNRPEHPTVAHGEFVDTSPTSHLSRQPLHSQPSLMQRFRQPSLHRQMTDPSSSSAASMMSSNSTSSSSNSSGKYPSHQASMSSSSSMGQMNYGAFGNRPRASTSATSYSHASSDIDRGSAFISPSSSNNTVSGAPLNSAISTSLSAELAGLGLGVGGVHYTLASHALHDVTMDDMGAQPMGRMSSSSSSSTTRTRKGATDANESSFLSHNTSSMDSSGMDDSLLSLQSAGGDHPNATASSSRWIHGRDTPPSSPAPSIGPRSRGDVTSISMHPTADEFGRMADQKRHQTHVPVDWSNTWPRTGGGSAEGLSSSLKQATQMNHSLSHSAVPGNLSPPVDLRQAGRSHSSMSTHHQTQQEDRRAKRNSRSFAGTSPLLESTARRGSLTTARRSNDSLHSDLGPPKSSRLGAEAIQQRRAKRMSASIPSEYEARRLHKEKQSQYDQVSDALDTLRRFLYQREGTSTPSTMSSRPTSFIDLTSGSGATARGPAQPSMAEQVSRMLAQQHQQQTPQQQQQQQQEQRQQNQRSVQPRHSATFSPVAPSSTANEKKLRHPPSGALPPRGTLFIPPSSHNPGPLSPVPLEGKSVEAEHIATLEDLAKRVRQMKHDNQRLLDDL